MRRKGQKLSEEARLKLVNNEALSKRVYMYSVDNKLVFEFKSVRDVVRLTNNRFKRSSVSKACNNMYKRYASNFYQGYLWSFEKH